jgi:hypothetical protein
MTTRSSDLATWSMPRRRADSELDGIPGTAPGAGLRVGRRKHKTRVMGLMALGDAPPRAIEEAEQRAFLEMPTECGKCKSSNLIWQHEVGTDGPPRRVWCFSCGWDTFFVMASQGTIPVLTVPVQVGQADPKIEQVRVEDVARRVRPIESAKRRRGPSRRQMRPLDEEETA